MPQDAHFAFRVSAKQADQSLLECLLPCIPYLSAEQWQTLLNQHMISVDNQVITQNVVVHEGQRIAYTVPDYQEAEVNTRWQLLWHNHEIAAIHKPANLPVNRTTRNVYNTLIQLLRRESPWPDAHLLHRLDLETSGVILIAQNNDIAKRYQSKLKSLIKRKIYRTVVYGTPPWNKLEFECDLNTIEDCPIRSQMHVVDTGQGKSSKTRFTLLKSQGDYSLIQCELFTGRKHQIRAQLAHLGHPILGDKIYSNDGEFYLKRIDKTLTELDHEKLGPSHHLLHAYELHLHNRREENGEDIVIRDELFSEEFLLKK